MSDHARFTDHVGAYLLGALEPDEARAFERHLEACTSCQEQLATLQPAADLLPRSVEQLDPPASLKPALMEIVEREARERGAAAQPAPRRSLRERLAAAFAGRRAPLAWAAAAVVLLAGVAGVVGGGLLSGDETRTLQAAADERRLASVSGTLTVEGGGDDGGVLRLRGLPAAGAGRVYQAWVQRDGAVVPQPTFEPAPDGSGSVAIGADLSDAQAVLVTRERRGGARVPSEQPVVRVAL